MGGGGEGVTGTGECWEKPSWCETKGSDVKDVENVVEAGEAIEEAENEEAFDALRSCGPEYA